MAISSVQANKISIMTSSFIQNSSDEVGTTNQETSMTVLHRLVCYFEAELGVDKTKKLLVGISDSVGSIPLDTSQ